jgi:oxygen-independent coproporphyrinogen-3 oxidase
MDHFAKPEDALVRAQAEGRLWRNFQGYTIGRESGLIGLGATAISDIGEAFAQNHSRTERYIPETEGAGLATYRGMHTSPEDRLRRHVITELMCHLGVRTDAVSTQFGIDFWTHFASARAALDELAEDGLVTVSEAAVQVTDKGRMFVRHVAMVFDAYSHKKKGEGPRFSRTV